MDYGITAFGAYIPRLRLSRGAIAAAHRWMAPSLAGGAKGSRAFCSWDEDSVTMAVESARDCLRGGSPSSISSVTLASTSLPYADLQNSAIVAAALALPESVATSDAAGSQRAATSALIKAFAARQDGALLIASDKPRAKPASAQEMFYGAGAATLRLGTQNVVARLLGSASVSEMFIDHFRSSDHKYDYFWEERWIRDEGYSTIAPKAIKAALAAAGLAIGDIDHFVMPSMMKGAALAVAKAIGFKGTPAPTLDEDCGYCGAAHALLMLAGVLETATKGQKILLVGFGQGADALVL
jgi:3-hydroxy-3-methylglutaryl CoA synthase